MPGGQPPQERAVGVPALELRGLAKAFASEVALAGVDLQVAAGEVHGLLGESGSGKSTLVEILAGRHAPDAGTLRIGGRDVALPLDPGRARDAGVSLVHQDLALIGDLTVAESLSITHTLGRRLGCMSPRRELAAARGVLERHELSHIDPAAPIADLEEPDRALVAIARALEDLALSRARRPGRPGVLVLDDPMAFLPQRTVAPLFASLRRIARESGAGVVVAACDVEVVREFADRITVLREGRVAGVLTTRRATHDEVVELMGGRPAGTAPAAPQRTRSATVITARGLRGGRLRHLDLEVRRGEIIGLTGLAGSGFQDVAYVLFGAGEDAGGTLQTWSGEVDVRSISPAKAMRLGMALIPSDRQVGPQVGAFSLREAIMLPVLGEYTHKATLLPPALSRAARAQMQAYDVPSADPSGAYASMSRAGQRKALLAKWLQLDPRLLLVDELATGIDAGTRREIFERLRAVAARGGAVLWASTDYTQLARVCDRLLVFAGGVAAGELCPADFTDEALVRQVRGITGDSHAPGAPPAAAKR